jgi:hypothetical protein
LVKNGNGSAVASSVNATQDRIKLDHIRHRHCDKVRSHLDNSLRSQTSSNSTRSGEFDQLGKAACEPGSEESRREILQIAAPSLPLVVGAR